MRTINLLDPETGTVSEEEPPAKAALLWLYKDATINKILRSCLAYSSLFSRSYALFQKSSYSRKAILPFIERFRIDTNEFLDPLESFRSFNDFFERRLKPEARPLALAGLVSPADGRLKIIKNPTSFDVKGRPFNLQKLVKDPAIAARFSNGHILTIRLAPEDYHRLHAPFDGTVKAIRKMWGPLFSVSPIALKENLAILNENKRVLIDFGDFAMVLVGATFVGTIHLHIQEGSTVKKGDELAHFSFGGSMCILLLKDHFALNNKLHYPDGEVLIKMGQPIAN